MRRPVERKVTVLVSKKLYFEMCKMQELLMLMHKAKYKKRKFINKIKVSDFMADVCRNARYKMQNGRS